MPFEVKHGKVDNVHAIAVALERLLDQFEKPSYWNDERTPLGYFEALEDLCPDLLDLAVGRCIQRCKYFPKPVEIRDQVPEELEARAATFEREHIDRQLRLAAPVEKPEPWTPEQEAAMAELRRALGGATHERRALPPHRDGEPRRLRPIGEILAGFRLPAPDDPSVLRGMCAAGLAPDGSTIRSNGKDDEAA